MNHEIGIDHITVCVENLQAAEFLFAKVLGFELIWSARDVGSDQSSMDTVVVQRGNAKIALMRGRDKTMKSQINEFIEKYGQGVQHFALEVDDIEAACREWEAHGVKFSGPVKEGRDGFGPLNMNMRRFLTIPGIEEEAVWTDSQYRWHLKQIYTMFADERELKELAISHDVPNPTE